MLTPDEKLILKNLREARKEAKQTGLKVEVSMFVGTEDNCLKIHDLTHLFEALQSAHPELRLESFVVPIPKDPQSAAMMHRSVIENVNHLFNIAHPQDHDMN